VRKTRIEVSNFKNAYININVVLLYLKLFMHVTVFCFVLLWNVVFEVFFYACDSFLFCFVLLCYVMLWLVIIKIL